MSERALRKRISALEQQIGATGFWDLDDEHVLATTRMHAVALREYEQRYGRYRP